MICDSQYFELIHKYLDGDATENDRKELEKHVAECSNCAKHLQELKKATAFVQSASHIEAPDNFTNQIMANLPEKKSASKWKHWMRKHPLLVAAAVFMLLMSTSISSVWSGNGDQVSVESSGNV